MGWFDEQIRERKKRDNKNFSDAIDEIASIITRKKLHNEDSAGKLSRQESISLAMSHIFTNLGLHSKPGDMPSDVSDTQDLLEHLCRPHGIMRRHVELESKWYDHAVGPMLGFLSDGTAVALIPRRVRGYKYFDPASNAWVKLNSRTETELRKNAVCFYLPFPLKKLNIYGIMQHTVMTVPMVTRFISIGILLVVTLVGMITPKVTHIIFAEIVPSGSMRLFWSILVFSVCLSLSQLMFNLIKSLLDGRIDTQMNLSVQAATMARVLSLPPDFFKKYSAGELTTKMQYFNSLCVTLYSCFMVTGLTSTFSLVYIAQIFQYAPALVIPALCVTAATLSYSVLNTFARIKVSRKAMEAVGKKNGMTYALIAGIHKIKMSGSEQRAFTRWTKVYMDEVKNTYGIPMHLLLSPSIGLLISLAGTVIMYFFAVESNVSTADYYAFNSAYGMVSGAFSSMVSIGLQFANIRPTLDQVRPIMETMPEIASDKKLVSRLSGMIDLNNISFRYDESMPWILNDFSLKIYPGQYVAVVGKTGCGKSTLLRLLLGFETPQRGAIYYDGRDLATLDLQSLRKGIGVVMQDDRLFHGDIYSNITISAPTLPLSSAWEAAEMACVADDIRAMPMGMNTMISEGSGGISGGQKQRLIIARAIAPKPRILLFDEATSALDNITQKKVSEALNSLKCTRVVIAHRLSTIRQCDRILVIDGGKIVEDGSYDQLLARGGFFTELVKHQQLDQ